MNDGRTVAVAFDHQGDIVAPEYKPPALETAHSVQAGVEDAAMPRMQKE